MPYVVTAYIPLAYILEVCKTTDYVIMAYIVMARTVIVFVVIACIVKAEGPYSCRFCNYGLSVIAQMVIAYIVMVYIVAWAGRRCRRRTVAISPTTSTHRPVGPKAEITHNYICRTY